MANLPRSVVADVQFIVEPTSLVIAKAATDQVRVAPNELQRETQRKSNELWSFGN